MRVLCITSHGSSLPNVRPEAEMFIGLQRAGVEMTVMTPAGSVYEERMRAAGIRMIDFAPRRKFEWRAIRRIRRELRSGAYDIMHLFNNRAIANGVIAAIGLPVKVIVYRGQTGNMDWYNPVAYLTHLNPRVDVTTCVAEAVRQDLLRQGVPPHKLVTIYKGHDLDWYRSDPADLSVFGIPSDAFVIGMVANARRRKGVPVLIQAAALLPPDVPVHVLLVGTGMDEYSGLIRAAPDHARFHVLGFRDDAVELIAACQVSVLPALRREGLSKSVIEAMANGVASIVTDTGGNAELVRDGVSGLVVPPGDAAALARAIERLYRNPSERIAMGAAARQRIATGFRVETTVEQLRETYRRALGSAAA